MAVMGLQNSFRQFYGNRMIIACEISEKKQPNINVNYAMIPANLTDEQQSVSITIYI